MKLSIIVPVYNMMADGKLEYCLNSILNQTISDYEIIAVDDASTDASLSYLRSLEVKYAPRLKVIASPNNLKQGGAKNLGIKAANGEWIGFVDSDDWVSPEMYEKLLACAESTNADVVGCDYSIVYEHTMQPGIFEHNNNDAQTGILGYPQYKELILAPGSMVIKIYKKELITNNQLWFPEHTFYEDNCMAPLWMLYSKHFERVEEPLYYYYQHADSTVHYVSESRCNDRLHTMDLLIQNCKDRGFFEKYRNELEYKYSELYLINTVFSYLSGKVLDKSNTISYIRKIRKGILNQFPDFEKNTYYITRIGAEEKKMVRVLMKSPVLFLLYYRLLNCYRKLNS